MDKFYPITSICKRDLEGHFTEEQIKKISDDDMVWIANKMADMYCDNGFWDDMEYAVQIILDKKEE